MILMHRPPTKSQRSSPTRRWTKWNSFAKTSGLSGICSRVTLAVVKAEKAWPLLRQVSAMSKSLADRLLICQPALARRTRAAGNDVRQGRYWSWFEELFIELF